VSVEIRMLRQDERAVLARVAPDVFDHVIDDGFPLPPGSRPDSSDPPLRG